MEISTILAGVAKANLHMSHFLSENIAADAPNHVFKTVLATSFRTNVIIHFISIEFPTERGRVSAINKEP